MILNIIKDEEKCACDLMEMLGIAQSALSYHMNILCESGVVNQRKDGKWIHYSINTDGMILAHNMFENFIIYK